MNLTYHKYVVLSGFIYIAKNIGDVSKAPNIGQERYRKCFMVTTLGYMLFPKNDIYMDLMHLPNVPQVGNTMVDQDVSSYGSICFQYRGISKFVDGDLYPVEGCVILLQEVVSSTCVLHSFLLSVDMVGTFAYDVTQKTIDGLHEDQIH